MFSLKWALCLLVAALAQGARAQQLFVTSPNVMRFNTPELVHVDGFDLPGGSAAVQLKLQAYPDRQKTFSERSGTVRSGTSTNIRMLITLDDLVEASLATKIYVYLVADSQALGFHKESVILVTGVQGYLFLQTDKPIYTPRQKVHLRVVSLNANMNPSNTEFTIDVKNPKGILFHRYDRRKAENGFVQETFELPPISSIGNWTVEAKYRNEYQEDELEAIIFEVREYVLPTFSVKIDSPNFILSSSNEVAVIVEARYVFGNDVVGSVEVLFSILNEDGSRKVLGKKREENFEGVKTISLTREDFQQKNLWFPQIGSRLLVEAIVTERATGKIVTKIDTSASFVVSPYTISFDRTPNYFKPGLPFLVNIDVKYANNLPAAEVKMSVEATAKTERQNRVQVFQHDVGNGNQAESRSDSEGKVSITMDIPAGAEDVEITVKTADDDIHQNAQAQKEFRILKQVSGSNQYLAIQIINRGSRLLVGHKIKTRVDFSDHTDKKVIYTVFARGRIVERLVKDVNGQTAHTEITVTPSMSPQTRILVYYAKNNDIIADLIVLDVEYKCRAELSITQTTADENVFRPSDLVDLKITGKEGAWVSLLGVDKAVYLLRSDDILDRNKMFRKIREMDLGCGPGGGRDSMSVFKNTGVSILTNIVPTVPEMRDSISCPDHSARKRRSVNGESRAIRRGLTDILASLDAEESDCCFRGIEKAQSESRPCNESSHSEVDTCRDIFRRCCEKQKVLMLPKGRSRDEADDGWLEIDEDTVEIDEREHFPETWINEFFQISNGDEHRLSRNLPDSITTWVISGVSVASSDGMCVAEPLNVIATKKFFVNVDLPYAAVRNEQLLLKATVYNFGRHSVKAVVYMTGDKGGLCFTTDRNSRSMRRRVEIAPGTGEALTFPIVPLKIGEYELTVSAISEFSGDRVIKTLTVRAEGVRRYVTESTTLDPQGVLGNSGNGPGGRSMRVQMRNGKQTTTVPLKFPDDAIPDTEACTLHVIGNLMGPMIPSADLDMGKKIRQPTGCGEQTMIHMGPLVYVTRYMKRTGQLTGELEAIAYAHIEHGYKWELTYKHSDGSYSSQPRYTSSTWLTAFVAKVFCQASEFPVIGRQIAPNVRESIEWLFKNAQNPDGYFEEKRRVGYGTYLFGQNLLNDATFTAFVVEAVSKCSDVVDLTTGIFARGLRKAVQYLEGYFESNAENADQVAPYTAAIVAYALTLQNNQHRFAANEFLREKASFDSATGMRFWSADGITEDSDTPIWYRKMAPAIDIETASYALLNQLALGSSEDYLAYSGPIAAWLIRQRTISGAFVSTTDTVIGLEALAEFAYLALERVGLNMNIKLLTGLEEEPEFTLTEANANSPFVFVEGLPIGGVLTVMAEGTGVGQLQVECAYNSPEREGEVCTFDLEVTTKEYKAAPGRAVKPLKEVENEFGAIAAAEGGEDDNFMVELTIRFRYIGEGDRVGMSILEVTLFSGFRPVIPDLKQLMEEELIDRYEVTSDTLLMYLVTVFKQRTSEIRFRTKQVDKVQGMQPVSVKLYDYYEPDIHYCTKFYHPKNRSPLLGTFCDEDENERRVCTCAETVCAEYWGFNRSLGGIRVMRRERLLQEACFTYDYVMKIQVRQVGQSAFPGIAIKMVGSVSASLKKGGQEYRAGDEVIFLWKSKCTSPHFVVGRTYLVMGMDGDRYVDKEGNERIRYMLDSTCHVVEWPLRSERPRYHAVLNALARMLQTGCQH